MHITMQSFINLLYAARMLDEFNPNLRQEQIILMQWAISDQGCHYIGSGPRPAQPLAGEEMRVQ